MAVLAGPTSAAAEATPQPVDLMHNVLSAPAPDSSAQFGTGPGVKNGTAFCTTIKSSAANVNTDCAQNTVGPHNESSIAVNPANPLNMIGGMNDYQLTLNADGKVGETILSQAHVTFDGGQTWSDYPVNPNSAYQATGDPAVAFDDHGTAYYATLGFRFIGPANVGNADVLVHTSTDGGKTWSQAVVQPGSGIGSSVGNSLDKEFITAWGNGNAIVTWTNFLQDQKGNVTSVTTHSSVSHDGGATWSEQNTISGSFNAADFTTPKMTADGRLFVSFINTPAGSTDGRDNVDVVELSPLTGAEIGSPITIATVFDGNTDYPIAFGRQTYQDSLFRNGDEFSLAVDPTNGAHMAVVWSDMRNSTLPAPTDPYKAKTNSDVIVSQSFDHGAHWSAPTALTILNDQFMPWGTYDTTGHLRIGFFDRQYDSANHKYGYSLATETTPGSLTFNVTQVTTALSDPTRGDRWFRRIVNSNFPLATAFMGDYSAIAATPDGGVVAFWTDMREPATFAGLTLSGEDAFFAKVA
ncbi:MAG TPA: sialidase family protein [Candidatus Dormibacteraeota bacterium]|nr:sialidase family protein [Candidatus Dormibacteraeota bacterium]